MDKLTKKRLRTKLRVRKYRAERACDTQDSDSSTDISEKDCEEQASKKKIVHTDVPVDKSQSENSHEFIEQHSDYEDNIPDILKSYSFQNILYSSDDELSDSGSSDSNSISEYFSDISDVLLEESFIENIEEKQCDKNYDTSKINPIVAQLRL